MKIEPVPDKWKAFGWNVIEINGHDMAQITDALDAAEDAKGRPTVILARTIKAKEYHFLRARCSITAHRPRLMN
jgi:transketolase